MAWVHPLDDAGTLDRADWIPVAGYATATGTIRGHVILDEPGSFDVLPLWRTWGPDHSDGFPAVIRIEVGGPGLRVPIVVAVIGVAATSLVFATRRRRAAPSTVTP